MDDERIQQAIAGFVMLIIWVGLSVTFLPGFFRVFRFLFMGQPI